MADAPATINWREWGEPAFQEAREQSKPVLLSIGAVWCHWCHVMDNTTYSEPAVAQVINRDFIPIRVDNDRRPDINDRYNQGGWPTTAFLTPEGTLIAGATYIPPAQMEKVLLDVKKLALSVPGNRALLALARSRQGKLPSDGDEKAAKQIDPAVVEATWEGLWHFYDPVHGGFGQEPKFPMVDALNFALYGYSEKSDGKLLTMVVHTLEKMGWSGVYDPVEGGFFRYSVTRDWSIPHFEKMLEDHAGLISLCLDVYRITRDQKFRERGLHALNYLLTTLRDADRNVFWGSQDADEEYYRLELDKRRQRAAPRVDRTVYTNWNCLVVSALIKAAVILEDEGYQRVALGCLSFFLDRCYRSCPEGGMAFHYFDGEPGLPGQMRDQGGLASALLDAHQLTGEGSYLDRSEDLVGWMIKNLWDEAEGGFYDIPFQERPLGALATRLKGVQLNAQAAILLTKLDVLNPSKGYRAYAERALAQVGGQLDGHGPFTGGFAQAVDFFLKSAIKIDLHAHKDPQGEMLARAAREDYGPRTVLGFIDGTSGDVTKAVICEGSTCRGPYFTPDQLRRALQAGP